MNMSAPTAAAPSDAATLRKSIGTVARRRRDCRLISLVLLPIVIAYVWHGFVVLLVGTMEWHYVFDPTAKLSVNVRSCNVDLWPCYDSTCATGRIKFRSSLFTGTQTVQYAFGHSGEIDQADFQSTATCDGPSQSCQDRCRVTITVPSTSDYIYITQSSDDTAPRIVVRVHPGVQVSTLKVKGRAAKMVVEGASFSSLLDVTSGLASIEVTNSEVAKAKLYAASNNVYFVAPSNPSQVVDTVVSYRSVGNYACFAGSLNTTMAFAEPWASCSLSTDASGWSYSAVQARAKYAPSSVEKALKFAKVTHDDVTRTMDELGVCCGSGCPFKSKCRNEAYTFVPYGAAYTGFETFLETLTAENATTLVPYCHRQVTFSGDGQGQSGGGGSPRSIKLTSDVGAVYYADAGTPQPNATIWELTEGGTSSDLQMLRTDAITLTTEVRDKYASGIDATDDDAFVVFNVIAAPGVPLARFVYTTQPVYLTVPPSLLSTLTFGMLGPTFKEYHVHFVSRGCDDYDLPTDPSAFPTDPSATYADHTERMLQAGSQLYKALLPWPRTSLWGELAYIDESSYFLTPKVWSVVKDGNTGAGVQLVPHRPLTLAQIAAWLSAIIAIVCGCMLLCVVEVVGSSILRIRYRKKELVRRVVDLKAGGNKVDGPAGQALTEAALAEGLAHEDDEAQITMTGSKVRRGSLQDLSVIVDKRSTTGGRRERRIFSPLQRPVALIDAFLIAPLRAQLTDSFTLFIAQTCVLSVDRERGMLGRLGACCSDSRRVVPASNIAIPCLSMRAFMHEYERFCMYSDLSPSLDVVELRRRLVREYGVAPHRIYTERILGMRWKSEEFLSPDARVRTHMDDAFVQATRAEVGESTTPLLTLLEIFLTCGKFVQITKMEDDAVSFEDITKSIRRRAEAVTSKASGPKHGLLGTITSAFSGFGELSKGLVKMTSDAASTVISVISMEENDDVQSAAPAAATEPAGITTTSEQLGFESVFCDFAEELGYASVAAAMRGVDSRLAWGRHPADETLAALGLQRIPVVYEELRGLHLRDASQDSGGGSSSDGASAMPWAFYGRQCLFVFLHMFVLSAPILFVGEALLRVQIMHSRTMDPSHDNLLPAEVMASPVLFYQHLARWPDELSPELVGFWWALFGIFVVVWFNLALVYVSNEVPLLRRPLPVWLQTARRETFRWIFGAFLFLLATVLVMSVVWILLACFLHPNAFLPWASAIVTFFAVLAWQIKRLRTSAAKLRADIKTEYTNTIRMAADRLARAERKLKDIEEKANRRQARKGDGSVGTAASEGARLRASTTVTGSVEAAAPAPETDGDEFDPSTLFDVLDKDGSDAISKEEFFAMFTRLDLNISESKQQLMFSYADSMELDERITRAEFAASWEWLQESMAHAIADSVGLSGQKLWIAVVTLAVLLLAVFAFLLVATVGFNTSGGFVAVVQSSVISASGVAVSQLMQKPKGEELEKVAPEELKGLIKQGVFGGKEKQVD